MISLMPLSTGQWQFKLMLSHLCFMVCIHTQIMVISNRRKTNHLSGQTKRFLFSTVYFFFLFFLLLSDLLWLQNIGGLESEGFEGLYGKHIQNPKRAISINI